MVVGDQSLPVAILVHEGVDGKISLQADHAPSDFVRAGYGKAIGSASPLGQSCGVSELKGDDLVRRIATQCFVKLRKTASSHSFNGSLRRDFTFPALFKGAFSQVATHSALITHHQQDPAFARDLRQAFPDRVTRAKHEGVVIKEEHPNDVGTVKAALELR